MNGVKSRLQKLECRGAGLSVIMGELEFDVGGDQPGSKAMSAVFRCGSFVHYISRAPGEDLMEFSSRAEREGMELAQATLPQSIILPPSAKDL